MVEVSNEAKGNCLYYEKSYINFYCSIFGQFSDSLDYVLPPSKFIPIKCMFVLFVSGFLLLVRILCTTYIYLLWGFKNRCKIRKKKRICGYALIQKNSVLVGKKNFYIIVFTKSNPPVFTTRIELRLVGNYKYISLRDCDSDSLKTFLTNTCLPLQKGRTARDIAAVHTAPTSTVFT